MYKSDVAKMSYHEHCVEQITGRLYDRAQKQDREGMIETCIQVIYNTCGAAVYANLPKEDSYDQICELKRLIAHNESHTAILAELERVTLFFREKLRDFEYDSKKIKQ